MKKLLVFFTIFTAASILLSCGSTDSTTNYQISISTSPSEGGTVSPTEGQYEEGTSLDITATPSEEYRFVEWQGDYEGTSSSATITVDNDKNIQAIFTKKEYALTVNSEGEGTVDESILQTTSTTDYESGTIVELTAIPAEGWKFTEWKGAITSTENPTQVTVDEPKEITAVFEKTYKVDIKMNGEGTITLDPEQTSYLIGTNIELTANPSEKWEFVEWQGDISSTENPVEFTIEGSSEVTAKFSEISVTDISLNVTADTIFVDEELELVASVSPENAFNQTILWESTNPEIASVNDNGKVTALSEGNTTIIAETEDGGFIAEAEIKVDTYFKEIGQSYEAIDGLTVTLNSLDFIDHETYYEYSINYTLKNNTDRIIDEGSFKMYFEDAEGGEAQFGFFGELTPDEELTRSYTWEIEDTEPLFDVLEYHEDNFFRDEPYENSLNWKVNTN